MDIFNLKVSNNYLDDYGHVNHASYLEIFEEARWDYLKTRGYARDWVKVNQKGPVVLEASIKYRKEVMGDEVVKIETQLLKHDKPILMSAKQIMYKEDGVSVAAEIELLFGMMDLEKRRLIKVEGKLAEDLFN